MPARSRLSIRTLVGLLIGGIGLMLIAQSSALLLAAAPGYFGAQRVAALSLADQAVFETLFYRRLSDTPVVAALAADAPIDDRDAGAIAEARRRAAAVYPEAEKLLRDLDLPGASAVLENLRFTTDAWAEVSPIADAAIHLPKAAREPASLHEHIRRASASIDATIAANDFVDAAIMPIDPFADRLILVRRFAWSMRDHLETIMRAADLTATDGKARTLEKIAAIAEQRGQAERDWEFLTEIAKRPDTPQVLVNAITSAGQWYIGNSEVDHPDEIKSLATGTDLPSPSRALHTHQSEVLAALASIATIATEALADRADEQVISVTRGMVIDAMSLAIAVLVTLAALLICRSRVARPLAAMTDAMLRLSERDLSVTTFDTGRGEEMDIMCRTLEVMRDTMLEAQSQAVTLAAHEASAAARAAEMEAAAAEMAQRQGEKVEPVADGLLQLAEGNLTCTLVDPLPREYEGLRARFNDALAFLQATLSNISGHIDTLSHNTTGIADAADALARRTQVHASTLQQAIAAVDALTATLGQSHFDSARAQALAAAATAEAAQSAAALDQTDAAIAAVTAATEAIENSIGQIDEFAFQANLVALKAGLDAAGAGAGEESTILLAAEMRDLGQRAAAAANAMKTQVHTATERLARSSRLTGDIARRFGRLQSSVGEINAAIDASATAARTQTIGLDAFRSLIRQIEQVTEQNAATADAASQAAVTLAEEADALKAALWRFRMDDAVGPARAA